MQNFRKFYNQIYAGSAPSEKDLEYLKNILGVKLVISLDGTIGQKINKTVKQLKMNHVIIPIEPSSLIDDYIKYLSRNIVSLLDNNQPVFVHCMLGKDRTGLALAIYRVKKHGWTVNDAIAEAKRYGYGTGIPVVVQKLWEKLLFSLSQKADIGSIIDDAVEVTRLNFDKGNLPPAFNPQQSFAPFEADSGTYKDIELNNYYPESVPQVGQYNNTGPIRGVGPIENSGILQNVG